MVIDVITLFPGMFTPHIIPEGDKVRPSCGLCAGQAGFLNESIIKRAQKKGLVKINLHNLRDFSTDKHHQVDDRPFGGGPGMLLLAEPIVRAFEYLKANGRKDAHKIILTPAGKTFGQPKARALSRKKGLIILCGHYEGFDQRIFDIIKFDDIISIGRYVLSGGELPSMVVMDSVIRLIPGVLGNAESARSESFSKGNELDYPQYTRPRDFRGHCVPEVLVSGNHQQIEKWRKSQIDRRS